MSGTQYKGWANISPAWSDPSSHKLPQEKKTKEKNRKENENMRSQASVDHACKHTWKGILPRMWPKVLLALEREIVWGGLMRV